MSPDGELTPPGTTPTRSNPPTTIGKATAVIADWEWLQDPDIYELCDRLAAGPGEADHLDRRTLSCVLGFIQSEDSYGSDDEERERVQETCRAALRRLDERMKEFPAELVEYTRQKYSIEHIYNRDVAGCILILDAEPDAAEELRILTDGNIRRILPPGVHPLLMTSDGRLVGLATEPYCCD